jgi:hypothetical protein
MAWEQRTFSESTFLKSDKNEQKRTKSEENKIFQFWEKPV